MYEKKKTNDSQAHENYCYDPNPTRFSYAFHTYMHDGHNKMLKQPTSKMLYVGTGSVSDNKLYAQND